MVAQVETSIWERVVDASWDDLSPEGAKFILRFKFKKKDVNRMNQLAAIAKEGKLTASQKLEIETYEQVGRALAVMRAKAESILSNASRTRA